MTSIRNNTTPTPNPDRPDELVTIQLGNSRLSLQNTPEMGKRKNRRGIILVSLASLILLWVALNANFELAQLTLEWPTENMRDKDASSAVIRFQLDDIPLGSPEEPLLLGSNEQLHEVGQEGKDSVNVTLPTPHNTTSSTAHGVLPPQPAELSTPNLNNSASSNSIMPHNDTTRQKPVNIDLVISFHGELGNHLLKIAHGKILQLMAEEDGRFRFNLRYLSHGNPKTSNKTRQQLQRCFNQHFSPDMVNLAEWTANSPRWKTMWEHQLHFVQQFYSDYEDPLLAAQETLTWTNHEDWIEYSFDYLADLIERLQSKGNSAGKVPAGPHDPSHLQYMPLDNLSTPFVLVQSLASQYLMDIYFDELHEIFTFNDTQCCAARPEADETVLHFRAFKIEFGNNTAVTLPGAVHHDRRELDPNRTAYELLGHLKRGDKVAILSRFGEEHMQPFIDALKERGIQVRAITGQDDVEDFCFLKSSIKEMVGVQISSFFFTAALLSDTVFKVRTYELENAGVKKHSYRIEFVNDRLKKKTFVHSVFPELPSSK